MFLGRRTRNFSGADLEGLVKNAASYAFERAIQAGKEGQNEDEKAVLGWEDLEVRSGAPDDDSGSSRSGRCQWIPCSCVSPLLHFHSEVLKKCGLCLVASPRVYLPALPT